MAAVETTSTYAPVGQFASAGSGAGQLTQPTEIAVEPGSANILITDSGSGRVEVFAPVGDSATYLTSFGPGTLTTPFGIAIDPVTGAIYISDSAKNEILRFTSDGAAVPTYTRDLTFISPGLGAGPGQIGGFNAMLAVDPSSHDILVADLVNKRLSRFTSAGAPVPAFNGTASETGSLRGPVDIAAGPAGAIYIVDGENEIYGGDYQVRRFTATGEADGLLAGFDAPSAVGVNPVSGKILVAADARPVVSAFGKEVNPRSLYFFAADGTLTSTSKFSFDPPGGYSAEVLGIAVDGGSGQAYGLHIPIFGGSIRVDRLAPKEIPAVEFGDVSAIEPTTAHVTAIAAGGGEEVTIRFEISTDGTNWTVDPDQTVTSASGEQVIEANLTNLHPGREYSVRASISTAYFTRTSANTATFVTAGSPPAVSRETVANLAPTSATLNGVVNPNGPQTTYHFEYGKTDQYGLRFPAGFEDVAGGGSGDHAATGLIVDLTPETIYHFRLVAVNALGVTYGDDQTFTTVPLGAGSCPNDAIRVRQRALALPECRAYEQVSPIVKEGAQLTTIFESSYVSDDGNRVMVGMERTNYPGADSLPLLPRTLGVRSATSWSTKGVDPPQITTKVAGNSFFGTVTVSRDLTRALVTSRVQLTPDAPSTGGLYIRDLDTDTYQFVGPMDLSSGLNGAEQFVGASDDLSTIAFVGGQIWREGSGLETVVPGGNLSEKFGADSFQVSRDGSRAYFEVVVGGPAGVYLHEKAKTIPISVSHRPGDPPDPQRAVFVGASPDGRYADFTTPFPLTSDTPEGSRDFVYRYDAETNSLTYLTDEAPYLMLTRPGSDIMFYGKTSGHGDIYYLTDGTSHYLAPGITAGGLGPEGVASPNGRYLLYKGKLYDIEAGTFSCPSCRTDGGPELGPPHSAQPFVPGGIGRHRPAPLLNDGTLFFDTPNPLVPSDSNGTRDVYSYNHGKVSLLTPGKQSVDAELFDVSPDGKSVFFITTAPLVGQDQDSDQDLYVSRVGGGLASQNPDPAVECLRDDCKATPGVGPELPFGGSEALSGPENFKPKARKRCGKGRHEVKGRGGARCIKQHQRRAKNNRRQAR